MTGTKAIYIASPYTIGNIHINVDVQHMAMDILLDMGFVPVMPLLSHYQHVKHPRPDQDWLDFDIELMLRCDHVLHLPGKSSGADGEVKRAETAKMMVFNSIESLITFYAIKADPKLVEKLTHLRKMIEVMLKYQAMPA